MSKIIDIFESGNYRLPIRHHGEKTLQDLLFGQEGILTIYQKEIEETGEIDTSRIKDLCTCIQKVLEARHKGSYAYEEIKNLSDIINSSIIDYIPYKSYLSKDDFYRVRIINNQNRNTNALEKQQLFHIPFDNRRYIGDYRYSIPGFPCLYLANSIYTCWQELKQPNLNTLQISRFIKKPDSDKINLFEEALRVYDLTFDVYNSIELLSEYTYRGNELYGAVLLYPLIAACSIQVPIYSDNNDSFKYVPEYVIPQCLLDILFSQINKSFYYTNPMAIIRGICYSSTRVSNECEGNFQNIVLSSYDGTKMNNGYSKYLKDSFYMTDVLAAWQLDYRIDELEKYENDNVQKIEIGGSVKNYTETKFGVLEYLLSEENGVEAKKIKF